MSFFGIFFSTCIVSVTFCMAHTKVKYMPLLTVWFQNPRPMNSPHSMSGFPHVSKCGRMYPYPRGRKHAESQLTHQHPLMAYLLQPLLTPLINFPDIVCSKKISVLCLFGAFTRSQLRVARRLRHLALHPQDIRRCTTAPIHCKTMSHNWLTLTPPSDSVLRLIWIYDALFSSDKTLSDGEVKVRLLSELVGVLSPVNH